jgi:hypothetical protein
MTQKEKITWIPIEEGPPDEEGPYLVTRYDGQYRAVITDYWSSASYEDRSGRRITTFPQWDGDPHQGGPRDGAYPEEGPVIAWALMPVGYSVPKSLKH